MNDDDTTISLSTSEMEERLKKSVQKADTKPPALLVIDGVLHGAIYDLVEEKIHCGRNVDHSVPLICPGVSRKHCILQRLQDGNYSIQDNGSKNGTFVNNQKIRHPVVLNKGDIIKLGTLTIKYIPKGDIERLTYDKLYREASTDQLTGCYNKAYFMDVVNLQISRCLKNRSPLSLIFYDLDRFKNLNDSFGHDAGDYVLRELSYLVREHGIREENDIFARYGGEEFAILLVKTEAQEAKEIAERIRKLAAEHCFYYDGKTLKVTLSIGISYWNQQLGNAAELLKIADQAMYLSKKNGRNQVS